MRFFMGLPMGCRIVAWLQLLDWVHSRQKMERLGPFQQKCQSTAMIKPKKKERICRIRSEVITEFEESTLRLQF
jgi:hypothetical protein